MKNASKINKLNKKGVVDVQFNWIFIMITGFVILLFIVSIVLSQKKNSDTQAAYSSMNQIVTILKGKQQAGNVYSEVSLPRTSMSFRCDPVTNYFTFKIEDSERIQMPLEIIFGPRDVVSSKVQFWSQSFDVPFPVTIFTYMTTADSIIMIYNTTDSSNAQKLFDDLPSNVTKKITTDFNVIKDYTKYKIVCIEGSCPTSSISREYIKISPAAGLYSYGNVTFYTKTNTVQGTVPYISKASLLGALFSDNSEYYTCQMNRAMIQYEVKRSLVEKRLELLYDNLNPGQCKVSIDVALNELVIPMRNSVLSWDNITNIYSKSYGIDAGSTSLTVSNMDLTLGSCPKIY